MSRWNSVPLKDNPEYSWIFHIKKGDILEAPNGLLRIVRRVSHGRRTTVWFSIRRCSWTTRCYTLYGGNDLKQMGYKPTGKNWPLDSEFDRRVEEEFDRTGNASNCTFHCCDIMGVA